MAPGRSLQTVSHDDRELVISGELKTVRELWQFTKLIRSKNAGPFGADFRHHVQG